MCQRVLLCKSFLSIYIAKFPFSMYHLVFRKTMDQIEYTELCTETTFMWSICIIHLIFSVQNLGIDVLTFEFNVMSLYCIFDLVSIFMKKADIHRHIRSTFVCRNELNDSKITRSINSNISFHIAIFEFYWKPIKFWKKYNWIMICKITPKGSTMIKKLLGIIVSMTKWKVYVIAQHGNFLSEIIAYSSRISSKSVSIMFFQHRSSNRYKFIMANVETIQISTLYSDEIMKISQKYKHPLKPQY